MFSPRVVVSLPLRSWLGGVRSERCFLLAEIGCTNPQSPPAAGDQPATATATASASAAAPTPLGSATVKAPEVADPTPPVPTERAQIISGTGALVGTVSRPGGNAAAGPAGDITLNFVNADVREVLPRILGDILHLNYTIDPKVQANVTIQTSRPIRQQDVLPVLGETLRASGLALVEANGVYRVTASEEAVHLGTAPVSVGGGGAERRL